MRYRRVTARYVRLVPIRGAASYGDVLRAMTPVPVTSPLWRPAADVCETPTGFSVVLDVAGMDDDSFDVQLYEDALVIEGERHVDACAQGGFYHAAELRQGRFHVEITLPLDVDPDGVEVTYERGILRVELPKALR